MHFRIHTRKLRSAGRKNKRDVQRATDEKIDDAGSAMHMRNEDVPKQEDQDNKMQFQVVRILLNR